MLQVQSTWESSAWAKRMAIKSLRNGLNDFDRFKYIYVLNAYVMKGI